VTYRDLIQAALQDLQIVAAGDTLSADDAQLGLDRLNDWIDALALEGLTIGSVRGTTWPLVPGLNSYTIGAGLSGPGTIPIPKPVSPQTIAQIGYYDTTLTPTQYILFGGVLTDQAALAERLPTLTAPVPTRFVYTPTLGSTGVLFPVPIPTATTLVGVIFTPSTLAAVQLPDPVALPPGYRRFVRSNLTMELAAAFEKPVPPAVARIAAESMARVKTANTRMSDLGFALGLPGVTPTGYDIRTDS
jgi:hypothetical protein